MIVRHTSLRIPLLLFVAGAGCAVPVRRPFPAQLPPGFLIDNQRFSIFANSATAQGCVRLV